MSKEPGPGEGEVPSGLIAFVLRGADKSIRPTLFSLITIGAMVAGALWLDTRAKNYIEGAAHASILPLEQRSAAHEKAIDEQDARMRLLEQTLAELRADVRSLKDDVHSLRERADRRR